jgi:hypothetical protein
MALLTVAPARQTDCGGGAGGEGEGEGGGGRGAWGGGRAGNFKHTWRTVMNKVQLNTAEWAGGQWDMHQSDHC